MNISKKVLEAFGYISLRFSELYAQGTTIVRVLTTVHPLYQNAGDFLPTTLEFNYVFPVSKSTALSE